MRLRGTVAVTAAASIAMAGTAAATAAPQKWSVTAQTGLPGNENLSDVAVTGARSGWAVGGSWDAATDKPLVYRWDGTGWHLAPVPAQVDVGLSRVAGSSEANIWAFGLQIRSDRALKAFRWNGASWQASVVENGDVTLWDADVLSPSNVWLAVNGEAAAQPLRHWDGRQWRSVAAPADRVYSMHFTSAKSGWAVGTTVDGLPRMLRWNGSAWKAAALPQIPVPAGASATLNDVMALSVNNVWAVGTVSWLEGDDEQFRPVVLHWNGSAWRRVATPDYRFDLSNLAPDGSGGFWVKGGVETLVNYRAGTWTAVPRPTVPETDGVFGRMANVPGTSTMLGVGSVSPWSAPEDDRDDGIFFTAR
ncbi:hypothetical protein [Spirillospora sp. CA-128828]|uniref:hypothetical protein n=1 Tax=Spirillospora sp. CA-128828 TaxID=3240033 RepID=UPI003D935E7B